MNPHVRNALIATVRTGSVEQMSQAVCDAIARPVAVLARVWLCEVDGHLRLAASAGSPLGGGSYHRLDGQFSDLRVGVGKIGAVAATRLPLIARQIRGDEDWLVNHGWIARQQVRSCLVYPLIAADAVVGVQALFDRTPLTDELLEDLRLLADVMAARISAMRAPCASASARASATASDGTTSPMILTRSNLRDLEKHSIEAALTRTEGRVFGAGGAAALLGMKPTTLASRIKALGIG